MIKRILLLTCMTVTACTAMHVQVEQKQLAAALTAEPRLVKAAREGNLNLVKKLISAGEKVNLEKNSTWEQPLFAAAHWGRREVVTYLIARGADVHATSLAPWNNKSAGEAKRITALIVSARYDGGYTGILQALVEAGAHIDADEINRLPIKEAVWITLNSIRRNMRNAYHTLTPIFILPMYTEEQLGEALLRAAEKLHLHAMRILLFAGAPVDVKINTMQGYETFWKMIADYRQHLFCQIDEIIKPEPEEISCIIIDYVIQRPGMTASETKSIAADEIEQDS